MARVDIQTDRDADGGGAVGVSVMKIYEYTVKCDNCTAMKTYHSFDWDNGIQIHDKRTALKASGYKVRDGQVLCPDCLKKDDSIRRNAPWR